MVYSDYKLQKLIIILFVLLGFVVVLLQVYNYNLGVTSDGVNYIEVARNILKGNGIVSDSGIFVNHWPPLYALVLAGFSKLIALDPFLSGKYLNAILLGISFWVFNGILTLKHASNKTRIVLNLFLLFSVPFNIFTWFLSEPLFITILLIALYFYIKWTLFNKPYLLIFSGLAFGFLILTRYAGLGLFGGFILYLLFIGREDFSKKIKHILLFIIAAIPLVLAWFYYSANNAGNIANRTISFHPFQLRKILSFLKTLLSWIIPFKNELLLGITGLVLLGLFIFLILRISNIKPKLQSLFRNNKNYLYLIGFPIATYLLFIVLSISFMDAEIPLDSRILSPVFPLFLLLLLPFFEVYFIRKYKAIGLTYFFGLIFILIISTSVLSWCTAINEGQGLTAHKFKNSATLQRIPEFASKKIYSNETGYISLYYPDLSKQLYSVPLWFHFGDLSENKNLEADIEIMKNSILNEEAVLIYFNTVNWKKYLLDAETVLSLFPDRKIINTEDGFIIE